MRCEKATDLQLVGEPVRAIFAAFAAETGRQLHLEIEPGTFLVCNAGSLVCTVKDRVTTFTRKKRRLNSASIVGESLVADRGEDKETAGAGEGHVFLKLDSGMTEIIRPSLYGAQHALVAVPATDVGTEDDADVMPLVIVGHCCESGDLLTPAPGEPEVLSERPIWAGTAIGDLMVVEGAGSYCSGMSAKNYNSFPEASEVMRDEQGKLHLIRRRQTLAQILQNEIPLPDGL